MPEDQQHDVAELQLNSESMSPSLSTESGVTGGVLGGDSPRLDGEGLAVDDFTAPGRPLALLLVPLLLLLLPLHSVRE